MTTQQAHNEAMKWLSVSANALKRAFEFEKRAAMSLLEKTDKEPTRSILFRTAAWLAMDCKELEEAEQMALHGLAGNPPKELKDELNEVLKRARNGKK